MTRARRLVDALGCALLLHLYKAAVAAVVAVPLVAAAAQRIAPLGGDDIVFARSERTLELVDALRASVDHVALHGSIVAILGAVVGLVPVAIVVEALARGRGTSRRSALGRATRPALARVPGFVVLAGVSTLLKAIGFAIVGLGLHALAVRLPFGSDRTRDLVGIVAWALGLAPVVALGITEDAARCAMTARNLGFYDATQRAFVLVRALPSKLGARWLAKAALVLASALAALAALRGFGVQTKADLAWMLFLSQASLFASEVVRVFWYATVLDLENGLRYGPPPPRREEG